MDKIINAAKTAKDFVSQYPLTTTIVSAIVVGFVLGAILF